MFKKEPIKKVCRKKNIFLTTKRMKKRRLWRLYIKGSVKRKKDYKEYKAKNVIMNN